MANPNLILSGDRDRVAGSCAQVQLPRVDVYKFKHWPEEDGGEIVEFRLIYKGPLPSQGSETSRQQKHSIRKIFHKQLSELWKGHRLLQLWSSRERIGPIWRVNPGSTYAEQLANNYALGPFRFLPLITRHNGLACALEILFLRRDNPGNLISNGGDIDNRIKVLFDALRRPTENDEIRGLSPAQDEDPFYCLLDDDQLITEVSVVTDKLLLPRESLEPIHDVFLVLRVKTKVIDTEKADLELWAEG